MNQHGGDGRGAGKGEEPHGVCDVLDRLKDRGIGVGLWGSAAGQGG